MDKKSNIFQIHDCIGNVSLEFQILFVSMPNIKIHDIEHRYEILKLKHRFHIQFFDSAAIFRNYHVSVDTKEQFHDISQKNQSPKFSIDSMVFLKTFYLRWWSNSELTILKTKIKKGRRWMSYETGKTRLGKSCQIIMMQKFLSTKITRIACTSVVWAT